MMSAFNQLTAQLTAGKVLEVAGMQQQQAQQAQWPGPGGPLLGLKPSGSSAPLGQQLQGPGPPAEGFRHQQQAVQVVQQVQVQPQQPYLDHNALHASLLAAQAQVQLGRGGARGPGGRWQDGLGLMRTGRGGAGRGVVDREGAGWVAGRSPRPPPPAPPWQPNTPQLAGRSHPQPPHNHLHRPGPIPPHWPTPASPPAPRLVATALLHGA